MSNIDKNNAIREAIRTTRIRRKSQTCKTFKFKVDKSSLSKSQSEALKMFFIETKRVYNHLLNEINNGKDLFTFDYKELKHIKYYDKNKNLLEYDIKYIGSSIISDTIIYRKIKVFMLKNKIKVADKKKKDSTKLQNELESLEERISKIKIKREEEKRNPYKIVIKRNKNVKFLIIIMIICALTGLLTPLGDTPYTYLYKTMQGNTTQNISEHLPMTLADNTEAMCMLIIVLAILIFTKTKIKLSDLIMVSGLCYLMLTTRRQISMFIIFNVFSDYYNF